MDAEEVLKKVRHIEEIAEDDDEVAHQKECELWKSVLQNIADGSDKPKELAKAALKTLDIDFSRYYS